MPASCARFTRPAYHGQKRWDEWPKRGGENVPCVAAVGGRTLTLTPPLREETLEPGPTVENIASRAEKKGCALCVERTPRLAPVWPATGRAWSLASSDVRLGSMIPACDFASPPHYRRSML
jgi:hypothetical protein